MQTDVKTDLQAPGAGSGPNWSRYTAFTRGLDWLSIFRTGTVFAVVIVVWLIFWRLTPFFLTQDNLYNIGIQASNVAIIAAGLTVVLIAAEIDLSIGAIQA